MIGKTNISAFLLQCFFIAHALAEMTYLIDIGNPGARYPITDIYDASKVPDSLKGQLNSVGMRQQYLLGTYIRADYIQTMSFLPSIFNPKTMEVYVCSVDRTIESALARMYGFYPLGTGWKIPQEVDPQTLYPPFETNVTEKLRKADEEFALKDGFSPIPVTKLEYILNSPCPNLGLLKSKRYQEISKTVGTFQAQITTFIAKMKLVFNLSSLQVTVQNMADLYDTVVSDITLGKQIPSSFDDFDLRELKYVSDYYNSLLYSGDFGKTLATLLLTEVQLRLSQAISDPLNPKKYSAYFPPEPTMTPMVVLLNLTSPQCLTQRYKNQTLTSLNCVDPPGFSSNLIVQLHEDESFQSSIKIKYNGEYVYLCEKKQYECKYNEFWGRIKKSVSRDAYHHNCYDK